MAVHKLQYGPAKLTRNYITAPSENAVMQLCSFVSILLDHTVLILVLRPNSKKVVLRDQSGDLIPLLILHAKSWFCYAKIFWSQLTEISG